MYVLNKRPLKKPGIKKPNTNHKCDKIYLTKLNQLPDEIFRYIYQYIFPIDDIKPTLALWCHTCGENIPDYETCIEQNHNCYHYTQISSDQKSADSKLHCLQCFIADIYPEWETSANLPYQNSLSGQINIL